MFTRRSTKNPDASRTHEMPAKHPPGRPHGLQKNLVATGHAHLRPGRVAGTGLTTMARRTAGRRRLLRPPWANAASMNRGDPVQGWEGGDLRRGRLRQWPLARMNLGANALGMSRREACLCWGRRRSACFHLHHNASAGIRNGAFDFCLPPACWRRNLRDEAALKSNTANTANTAGPSGDSPYLM